MSTHARLGDPDYFGERALLGGEIRSASIAALEDDGWDAMKGGTVHPLDV